MKKQHVSEILAITTLAFSSGTIAQNMSASEYKAAGKDISNEYKSDQMKCGSFASNDRNICMAVAKGKEKIAKSKLDARYIPSYKTVYQSCIEMAQADYAATKEKCDDKADNDKGFCVNEANIALQNAKSDAMAQLNVSKTIEAANEESFAARM